MLRLLVLVLSWTLVWGFAASSVAASGVQPADSEFVASSGADVDVRQSSRTACAGYVFRVRNGAFTLGHVAWGVIGNRGGVAWGSVEGWQKGSADKDYFTVESDRDSAMINDMRRRGFDDYLVKSLPSGDCNYDAAVQESISSTEGWYLPSGANCADATKAVLKALGFGESALGDLFWTPRPNNWFDNLRYDRGWSYRSF